METEKSGSLSSENDYELNKNDWENRIINSYNKKKTNYIYLFSIFFMKSLNNLEYFFFRILIFNMMYILVVLLDSRVNDLSHIYDGLTKIIFKKLIFLLLL